MGTLGVVVSSMVMDSHSSPCLCLDALPSCNLSRGDSVSHRNSSSTSLCRRQIKTPGSLELSSSFLDRRGLSKGQRGIFRSLKKQQRPKKRSFTVVSELGGQYEETFEDVKSVRIFNLLKVYILTGNLFTADEMLIACSKFSTISHTKL